MTLNIVVNLKKYKALQHKENSICFMMNKTEVNLSQETINFITDTYQKVLQCWKKVVLKRLQPTMKQKNWPI